MPYIGRTTNVRVRQQRFEGDGVKKIFTMGFIPVSDNQISVYLNGAFLNDQDFVYKHPNKVIFNDAPSDGAEVLVVAPKATDFQSTRYSTHIADGTQRIFNCEFTPPTEYSVIVSKNGDILQDRDYILSGSKVILEQIPANGDEIEIRGLYDIIDPSGNAQASNNLDIQRTRQTADGFQNIFAMHQKPDNENNLLVMRGTTGASILSNQLEYAIASTYKYVHGTTLGVGTELEFRSLKGDTYTNLNRRVMVSEDVLGHPTAISLASGGSSGYTTANDLEARGGSGRGLRVNITASGGVVTGVTITGKGVNSNFATGYNTSETLTIIQSGSTNDATLTISTVEDLDGQRYFDVNGNRWDSQNNQWQTETTYELSGDEQDLLVSIDGIIQPYNEYTVINYDFNNGEGAINQVVDVGSVVGDDSTPATIEIRDLKELVGDDDVVIDSDTGIERIIWTATNENAFNITTGYDARTSNFATAFNSNLSNEEKFLVIVNGIIQDRDTWALTNNTLTIGGNVGGSDDSATGADVFVELIFFTSLDATCQDARQITMTGDAATGIGDHKFIRLYDRDTGVIELHPDSEASVIIDINGVYQNDHSYFIEGNKVCFYDEAPNIGSEINVKVLKCSEVAGANTRRVYLRGDGSSTSFTLPFTSTNTPPDFGVIVSVNRKVYRDTEFSLSGTTLTFNVAPSNDAFIEVTGIFDITTYSGTSSDTNLEVRKRTFTADGVQQIYDLTDFVHEKHAFGTVQDTYNEQKIMVFLDGEFQGNDKYLIIGSKLYMTSVPSQGLKIEVVRFI